MTQKIRKYFSYEANVSKFIFTLVIIAVFGLVFGQSVFAAFVRLTGVDTQYDYGYGYGNDEGWSYGYGYGAFSGTALEAAITLAGTKVQASYTAGSWTTMQDALTAAEAVDADLTATQAEVTTATTNLTNAIAWLTEATSATSGSSSSGSGGGYYYVPVVVGQSSNCPVGYTCVKLAVVNCPTGYTCTRLANYNGVIHSANFERDLDLGLTGDDVLALQIFLNGHGFAVAKIGVGSPGNETTYFGRMTQAALAKYQKANGISPAVGYFGPKTRAHVKTVGE